jgi:crossover junction endodeoxyribonuclease RuvC
MRVLGIDTALRCSGLAVVDRTGNAWKAIDYGLVKNSATAPHSICLLRLQEGVREMIRKHKPDVVAIEGIFFAKNVRTAVILGQARGAVIAACAAEGLPVYEHAPRSVKQALVGFGGAHKGQVSKMAMALLGLREAPPEDAADALGIAICHLQQQGLLASVKGAKPL